VRKIRLHLIPSKVPPGREKKVPVRWATSMGVTFTGTREEKAEVVQWVIDLTLAQNPNNSRGDLAEKRLTKVTRAKSKRPFFKHYRSTRKRAKN